VKKFKITAAQIRDILYAEHDSLYPHNYSARTVTGIHLKFQEFFPAAFGEDENKCPRFQGDKE